MRHNIEIDQSTKIEEGKDTVLAFSNGIDYAVIIPATVKRQALGALHDLKGKSRKRSRILLFAAGLFLLLRDHLDQIEQVTIDTEYPGHENDIRTFLLHRIRQQKPDFAAWRIAFKQVGKKSPADRKARAVREKRDRNYGMVTIEEMLKVLGIEK